MAERFAGCLETLRSRSLVPASCQSAFVAGSAARGWANNASDYDIWFVSSQPWEGRTGTELRVPLDPPSVPTETTYSGGRRWELKYWLDAQVGQMLAKVSWDQYERGLVAGELLGETEEVFLDHLVTAVPLSGADWLRRRCRELNASAFRAFVVTRSLAWSDDGIEDAIGQLAQGDLESAVLSARKAFGHTIDALLESHGEYGYYAPKWRARRFRQVNPGIISFADYWDIETMRDLDPSAPGKWVEKVIAVCRNMTMDIEVPEPAAS
jgi:hypothetical protein